MAVYPHDLQQQLQTFDAKVASSVQALMNGSMAPCDYAGACPQLFRYNTMWVETYSPIVGIYHDTVSATSAAAVGSRCDRKILRERGNVREQRSVDHPPWRARRCRRRGAR